ncbi:hypothetical protein [Falsiroseomonas selenitidurans]|uniref:Uncharacterized protein n=1 Tax=Falsiroseomonas selenitidurans TaxID=2716335 RepID=A0ABX1E931_9PROT|nr:hypothetical protein [Falsiroseomonas selenitidurans]NKC32277.1 hypothetical protein [Falsiroseomonas selenitidurans]
MGGDPKRGDGARRGAAGRRPGGRLTAVPKEVRYIVFSAEEVQVALAEGLAAADPGWARANPRVRLDMATAPSGEVVARLVPPAPRPGRRRDWTFQATDILPLLLQACRRHRIPLPLRGQKRLEMLGSGLCLTVTLGDMPVEPEMLPQLVRYQDPALTPLLARKPRLARGG